MLGQHVVHTVDGETLTFGIRKEHLSVASLRFSQLGFQHCNGGFRQRCATFLAALADYPDVRSGSKQDVLTLETSHFRQTQTCLCRQQDKRVIATPEPSPSVGRGEQRIHFGPRKKADQSPGEALGRNGEHALDLRGMNRRLKCRVTKEEVNRSQPQIATPDAQPLILLQVIEKPHKGASICSNIRSDGALCNRCCVNLSN